MSDFASVCILSYKRPDFVQNAIETAKANANFPLEIIVHDDGSEPHVQAMLLGLLAQGSISKLIMNPPGQNQGVGEAVRVAFAAASGDWLVKADQDLIFAPNWLRRAVGILENDINVAHAAREKIGMVGLFHYHSEPCRTEEMLLYRGPGFQIHKDFVSSAFVIKRELFEAYEWPTHSAAFAEDVEFKHRLQDAGYALALPDEDIARNRGFGVGPSTVVVAHDTVATINMMPMVFQAHVPTGVEKLERPLENALVLVAGEDDDVDDAPELTPEQEADDIADARKAIDEHLTLSGNGPLPLPAEPDDSPNDRAPFDVGVVITTCAGREANVKMVLDSLDHQIRKPMWIVIVYDGCPAFDVGPRTMPIRHCQIPKHRPGLEQPRNVGVRQLQEVCPEANYVWFIDSDVVVCEEALLEFADARNASPEERILVGPYEFLPPGYVGIHPEVKTDGRWVSFNQYGREHVLRNELGSALACFGGNLVWPIDQFISVGGFHPNLHHGRCEDGELGLRAVSQGCGVSFVAKARGYHQYHTIDYNAAIEKNRRDVPLLNQMHPWVERRGLIVTAADGARFDFVCPQCDEQVNSLEYWNHTGGHQ